MLLRFSFHQETREYNSSMQQTSKCNFVRKIMQMQLRWLTTNLKLHRKMGRTRYLKGQAEGTMSA